MILKYRNTTELIQQERSEEELVQVAESTEGLKDSGVIAQGEHITTGHGHTNHGHLTTLSESLEMD